METARTQVKLEHFAVGSRLVVRSRNDWRVAAISKIVEGRVTLTVCSPSGRTYRLRRDLDCEIVMAGLIPVIVCDKDDDWREKLVRYDLRW